MEKNLICIGCPLGCPMIVTVEGTQVVEVKGHTCPRGEKYAHKEVTDPTRTVTSTVRLQGSMTGTPVISCKTATDIPKGQIRQVMEAINAVVATAPVTIGQVLAENIAGTGVALIATKAAE
ncbi:MAG: DUF1667 domain-containing protein [Oscillospiraceae bacterium]|nr:DUF1667 domain-containing protein [Oscillospiraceae bacterium]